MIMITRLNDLDNQSTAIIYTGKACLVSVLSEAFPCEHLRKTTGASRV